VEITLPRHYRGPLTSANGGYACGRLAAFVDADEVEVTLRLPPPLDRPLAVERDFGTVRLVDGDALVAEARPAPVEVDAPAPVAVETAEQSRDRHARGWSPEFNECFVCGVRDDGLRSRCRTRSPRSCGRRSTARGRTPSAPRAAATSCSVA
jgi:hypothetical protein